MLVRSKFVVGLAALLFFISIAVYGGAINSDFVNFDDHLYGPANPMVAAGLSPKSVVYACTTFDVGNWIPLTWLSLELDVTLFGQSPGPLHRTNVLLHGLNVVLLFLVFRRMTLAVGRSAIVALFFAVHPLHVESVAWISERKDVLSTTFLLLAMMAYERYAARPGSGRWALVALAMTCGLLAKSMLVTLPILLLLLDWWPLNRIARAAEKTEDPRHGAGGLQRLAKAPKFKDSAPSSVLPEDPSAISTVSSYPQRTMVALVIEKLPLFGLAFLDGLITIAAQKNVDAVRSFDDVPFVFRVGNAFQSYGWYLWKTILPTNLCALYVHPRRDLQWGWVAIAVVVLLLVTMLACRDVVGHRYRQFGWGWFVISFLPVIGLMQIGGIAHADRYAYVPHIGLFVLIVWEAYAWLIGLRIDRRWGAAIGLGIAVLWSIRTVDQVAFWHDGVALWSQVVRQDPSSDDGHQNLGGAYFESGNIEEAEKHFRQAIELSKGTDPKPIHNLGEIQARRGDRESAIEYYRWATRIDPDYKPSKRRLVEFARRNPKQEAATATPQTANPARAEMQLGLTAARSGEMTAALRHFQAAIQINPDDADAHNNAAFALIKLKRPEEAEAEQRQAVRLAPSNADFHVNLAAFVESSNPAEAIKLYRKALQLRPQDVEAQRRLQLLESKLSQP